MVDCFYNFPEGKDINNLFVSEEYFLNLPNIADNAAFWTLFEWKLNNIMTQSCCVLNIHIQTYTLQSKLWKYPIFCATLHTRQWSFNTVENCTAKINARIFHKLVSPRNMSSGQNKTTSQYKSESLPCKSAQTSRQFNMCSMPKSQVRRCWLLVTTRKREKKCAFSRSSCTPYRSLDSPDNGKTPYVPCAVCHT